MCEILPEDLPPFSASICSRCELSTHRKRVVWGEGSPKSHFFILLDNPGLREDRLGQPFLCGTRETLLNAIKSVGILKDNIYISYLLKCRPIRAYDRIKAWNSCLPWFRHQIKSIKPHVMMGLGNNVARALIKDPTAEVKALRGKSLQYAGVPLFISYHPLAARRRPKLYWVLQNDIEMAWHYYQSIH